MVSGWFDWTAFLPPVLFHIVWNRLFDRLLLKGVVDSDKKPENLMVPYIKENKIFPDANGNLTARFKSSFLEVTPGRSAYICNVQKSFWNVLDKLESQDESDL